VSEFESQPMATVRPGQARKITVLNPACSSTTAERTPLAHRIFSSLNDKTVFLVDIGWGGPKAGYDVLDVMQGLRPKETHASSASAAETAVERP
jgi:hypothetical protein